MTLNTVRPGERLLPVGFETLARTYGTKSLAELDKQLNELCPADADVRWIDAQAATLILESIYGQFEPESIPRTELQDTQAALYHFARNCGDPNRVDKVGVICWRDREIARLRSDGRYQNSPDTKQQADLARQLATQAPLLMLFRQNGAEKLGWKGLPFWWPVAVAPTSGAPVVFAKEDNSGDPASPSTLKPRKATKKPSTSKKGSESKRRK